MEIISCTSCSLTTINDVNYINWTDIYVPQEPTSTVETERDSSRTILRKHQTDTVVSADGSVNRSVRVPVLKGPEIKEPEVGVAAMKGSESMKLKCNRMATNNQFARC